MAHPIEGLTTSLPSWGARLAFGESIKIGERVAVPAALVVFGFGGGGGSGKWPEKSGTSEGEGEGSGGGGGGYVLPIGVYSEGPGGLRFRPNPVALIIASVPLISAAGWAVARIVTAARTGRPA